MGGGGGVAGAGTPADSQGTTGERPPPPPQPPQQPNARCTGAGRLKRRGAAPWGSEGEGGAGRSAAAAARTADRRLRRYPAAGMLRRGPQLRSGGPGPACTRAARRQNAGGIGPRAPSDPDAVPRVAPRSRFGLLLTPPPSVSTKREENGERNPPPPPPRSRVGVPEPKRRASRDGFRQVRAAPARAARRRRIRDEPLPAVPIKISKDGTKRGEK